LILILFFIPCFPQSSAPFYPVSCNFRLTARLFTRRALSFETRGNKGNI
jgi:hypothetical protein